MNGQPTTSEELNKCRDILRNRKIDWRGAKWIRKGHEIIHVRKLAGVPYDDIDPEGIYVQEFV